MTRFPIVSENELSDAQKSAQDGIANLFSRFPSHLTQKNDQGLFYGPYSSLFYTEDIADPWLALASKVMRQKRFTFKEKELCILAVASEYDVPYLQYAHSEIGIYAGFTKEQVQQAFHGKLPSGLSDRESTVYNLALKLTKLRKPLDDASFEHAREILGQDGVAGVAHIVSGYIYVSMLSNIADVGAPKSGEGTFIATKNPDMARE
ncbi:AhpD-like protein [Daldinia decipiens]|uniref:AhpD-like protein n=1 Tax=Daldinia decipiens TaxID=326647 RepID=UPI0020C208E0|nr:AhpD-like protein [Daldinia decipiens]KAI1662269.1 AhpD-like protein [Daldinia decipiens]